MKTLYRARDVPPRDRISHWHKVVSQIYACHQSRIDNARTFDAVICAAPLADLQVSRLEITPARLMRTAKDIGQSINETVFIWLQLAGLIRVQQDGLDNVSKSGDLLLLDAQRPYSLSIEQAAKLLILKVPARKMLQRIGPTLGLSALAVPATDGIGALVSGYLDLLTAALPIADHVVESRIADLTLDLSAIALSSAAARAQATLSSPRVAALASLRMAIDRNLADPSLNPAAVAAASGISVRYANELLAEQGTSIVRLILARRIERCRQVLADPAHAHRAITEIALSWGFSDLSHFGRRFREIVGMSPREYRSMSLRDD